VLAIPKGGDTVLEELDPVIACTKGLFFGSRKAELLAW
jgi:hypothetical protein